MISLCNRRAVKILTAMKTLLFIFCLFSTLIFSCKNVERPQDIQVIEGAPEARYSCAPVVSDTLWYLNDNKAPLFEGMSSHTYPITTNSAEAQKYFDQGLVLSYGFNHAEAARSFYYATKLDPECAMCYWGYAYVLGPVLYGFICPFIISLFHAGILDQDYRAAMKKVQAAYRDDADISAMYAESIMNLHPWDLYDKEGKPKEWTPEIVDLLEKVIEENPDHPGAHHFYIHAVEASNTPEMGLASARAFDNDLVPGAGHLVHMPSHIYIRTGEYHKGTLANIRAVQADSLYVSLCHAQGAYPLAYYPHNYHFMAATATLEGSKEWAMEGANKLSAHIHPDLMKQPGWGTLQHYYVIPLYVMVKLGEWDQIIITDHKTYDLPYLEAVKNYARGMAYLRKNQLDKAREELVSLEERARDESLKEISIWEINTVDNLVQIARRVLQAEILAAEENYDESISLLQEAVDIEDALNYDEPPDWFFSVRHHLGAVQIEAGQYEDAIITFKEDLQRLPRNGWAHHGLKLAYEKLGDTRNVQVIEELIKDSWAYADISISSSTIRE